MNSAPNAFPRLTISGLSGGSGKTIVSLGLARAVAKRGLVVSPFKKGPDYIDAAWLALAAEKPPCNLDPHFLAPETLRGLFASRATTEGISLIEGNRGLFDGKDVSGSASTAELARILACPVVLVMDATKMTRTAAAVVAGCRQFEQGLNLAGVVLNRTASDRHRKILRESIESYTDVPVLGMLPKLTDPIPERHMGLASTHAEDGAPEVQAVLDELAELAEAHLNVPALLEIARSAPALPEPVATRLWPEPEPGFPIRIGYVRDAALWFYYEENLEALRAAGAELVQLSLLSQSVWPEIHGLYLGGGFPETMGEALARNTLIRQRVRSLAEMGLPIYAECGGFMYLCRAVRHNGAEYPMSGVFPMVTELFAKPQGLGYAEASVICEQPFHPKETALVGHEFHYSKAIPDDGAELTFCLKLSRGNGMLAGFDGVRHKNTFAAYLHTHALNTAHWATRFVTAARAFKG